MNSGNGLNRNRAIKLLSELTENNPEEFCIGKSEGRAEGKWEWQSPPLSGSSEYLQIFQFRHILCVDRYRLPKLAINRSTSAI